MYCGKRWMKWLKKVVGPVSIGGSCPDYSMFNKGMGTMTRTIIGSRKADTIHTDDENHVVISRKGGDDIITGAGNDVILAGRGNDTVNAGDGNDVVLGGKGADVLNGGLGNDVVSGGRGRDILVHELVEGSQSHDVYQGGRGCDTLRLMMTQAQFALYTDQIATFEEWLLTAKSWQHFTFDFGDSTLQVSSVEKLEIQIGDDIGGVQIITGSKEDGPVSAGDSASTQSQIILFQGDADATLEGGSANDILKTDEGNDTLDGGAGDDNLDGGAGDDDLRGGADNDTLTGGAGDDHVDGGDGDDTIIAANGQGNDFYDGGNGSDTIKFTSSTAINDLTIDMRAVDRSGQSVNGVSIDTLLSDNGQPVNRNVGIAYDSANPTQIGVDVLVNLENVIGGDGNDIIYGNFQNNEIFGGDGNDSIYGIGGDNYLDGGNGDDLLQVSYGANVLRGGAGADRFFMLDGIFEDRIMDFELGVDVLDLSRTHASNLNELVIDFSQDLNNNGINDTILNYTDYSTSQRLVIDDMSEAEWNDLNANHTGTGLIYAAPSVYYTGTSGDDTAAINLLGTGNDQILAGAGDETITVKGGDYILQGSGNDTIDYSDTFGVYSILDYSSRWDGGFGEFDEGIVVNINVGEIGTVNNSADGTVDKGSYGVDQLVDVDMVVAAAGDGFLLTGTHYADSFTIEMPSIGWMNVVPLYGDDTIVFNGSSAGRVSYEGYDIAVSYGGGGVGGRAEFDGTTLTATIDGTDTNGFQADWTDTVTATASLEFAGGYGDDVFLGADTYSERFIGGSGNNYFDGGAGGNDRVRYDRGNDSEGIQVDLENPNIDGSNTITQWLGDTFHDTLIDIEWVRGSNFNDSILMSSADEQVEGRSGDDVIDGRGGNDLLQGQNGNDHIFGGTGDDFLAGGSGDDQLFGGAGFDTLEGGSNDDLLTGGLQGDTFVFSGAFAHDTITDFASGEDFIDISASGTKFADWDTSGDGFISDADAFASLSAGDLMLDIGGNTITLSGITQLVESDLVF